VRGHRNPGSITLEDLAAYRVRDVEPLCGEYRQKWKLCGMPPSSSGGIAVLQMLGFLERHDMAKVRPGSPSGAPRRGAGRLAFADRNKYVGDDRSSTCR
jgi:gamma-glutamyltranspeptidase/glutathione hydrolase